VSLPAHSSVLADDGSFSPEENRSREEVVVEVDEKVAIEYNDPPDSVVEELTLTWIRNAVVGLNLCPFADRPLRYGNLTTEVIRGTDSGLILGAVGYHMMRHETEPGTTLVVAPEYHPDDFRSYLELVQHIEEEYMPSMDLDGIVQLAPFHPMFEFEGSGTDGADNLTNRSPYPIFHILREEEVERAVDKIGGDASRVWSRNVELMKAMVEALGRDGAERAIRGERVEGLDEVLMEIKRSKAGYEYQDDEEEGSEGEDIR